MSTVKESYAQITEDTGQIFIEISNIISSMPGHSGNNYNEPSESALNSWGGLMTDFLAGNYLQASLKANSLGYDVIRFTDTTEVIFKTYFILKNNGSNYWGTYIYNPDYCRPLVIQVPHPLKEINTGQQGIYVFHKTEALFYCLSGTSRCNNSTYSGCDGSTTICSGTSERYRISDMAHNVSSIFQKTTEILLNSFSNTFFVQLHGFAKLATDPYLILSNGTQVTPLLDYSILLQNNLLVEDGSLTFKIAHVDLDWSRLRAFDNTQGRLINSSADPCYTNATTTNGRFLSIEQERTKLRDDETGWNKMANALCNTFVCYNFVWNGSSDSDWGNHANWRENAVPTILDNVTIVNHINDPVINAGPEAPAICNHLEIQNEASLKINSGKALTVVGKLSNWGSLTIKSDASGTGSLVNNTPGVNAQVENFLTRMKWHFIGMPVDSAVTGVFHLPGGHSDIWLMPFIESTNSWGETIVPVDSSLVPGKGYSCWVGDDNYNSDETIVFSGILNAGDYTTGTGGFYGLTCAGEGYNFISHPYPSSLQGNIATWSKTNVDNSIWVWQGTGTTMAGGGNYLTWNGITGSLTDGIIPAMQGFFVKVANTGATLTIPQSSRTHSSQLFYKGSELPLNTLRIDVEGNECYDAAFIGFNQLAGEDYDSEFDVRKLYGIQQAPQLYSIIPGNELSINILPETGDDRIVPIGFGCEVPSAFKLEATGMDGFDMNTEFYLEDLKEGVIQNIGVDPVYLFTSESGDDPARFRLHLGNPNTFSETDPNPIRIYAYNGVIHILNLTQGQASVCVFDLMGRQIAEKQINGENTMGIKVETGTGYYVVKVQTGEQYVAQKVFIK